MHPNESSRTQRDFDRDDSEPTGVQGMTQMARIVQHTEIAKHAGVQRFNEYTILVTRHNRFRRIPPDTQQRIGRDVGGERH
jgi:hypothetical protein